MAPWIPVALPPRFAAARHVRIVGRRYELEVMETVWERVVQGHGQVVLLGGEPGAGKSRLAAELAGALHDRDVAVLVGNATKDAGVPYQPFVEMLDQLFLAADPGSLTDVLGDGGADLRRLTAHVDRHVPGGDTSHDPAGVGRRARFEAVAGTFRRMAQDRPLAVVIDDLHWVQLPSIALLEHMIHSCLTPRPSYWGPSATLPRTAPTSSAPGWPTFTACTTCAVSTWAGSTPTRSRSSCAGTAGCRRPARAPAAILRDRTGGNPFFLRETWIDLERRGGVSALRGPQRFRSPSATRWPRAWQASGIAYGRSSIWRPYSATASTCRRWSAPARPTAARAWMPWTRRPRSV